MARAVGKAGRPAGKETAPGVHGFLVILAVGMLVALLFFGRIFPAGAALAETGAQGGKAAGDAGPKKADAKVMKFLFSAYGQEAKKGFFASIGNALLGPDPLAKMDRPHGVAVAPNGNFYVTDTTMKMVFVFGPDGKFQKTFGQQRPTPLRSPTGIAIDAATGKVYVSDPVWHQVFVYNAAGKLLTRLGTEENKEAGKPGVFVRPSGIAVNSQLGRIYVVDTENHWVQIFNRDGQFVSTFGKRGNGDGEFNFPTHITVDKENKVYVADTLNFRVQVFDADGKFLFKFGKLGDAAGDMARPKGIAVDGRGQIFVSDAYFQNIQAFDQTGNVEFYLGEPGGEDGKFLLPAGMAVDGRQRLYIVDSENHRVQVFAIAN